MTGNGTVLEKKVTGLRIVCCGRPSLTEVVHRDVDWTLPSQVGFGRAELRHPSCAILGTCILRFLDLDYSDLEIHG